MTITHKLSKQEQVNPMELDIVQKREIPTLLPIQLISSFSGIKLRFTITQEVRVIDYLGSGITFGQFLQAVRQVVKTILACQARGISVNNLELEDSFLFLDFQTKRARLLYWPITSVTEDVDLVGFFIRLGSRYYRANRQDGQNRREYLDLFNSRAVFDAQRFDGQLEQLQKKWLEALRKQAEQFGVARYFDGIYGAEDGLGGGKEAVARSWLSLSGGTAAGQTLFIGDTLHDCEAARAIGCRPILVSFGHQDRSRLKASGAAVIDRFEELYPTVFEKDQRERGRR